MKINKILVFRLLIAFGGLFFIKAAASQGDFSDILVKTGNGKTEKVSLAESRSEFNLGSLRETDRPMIKNLEKSRTVSAGKASFGKGVEILVTGYSSTVDQCDGDPFTMANGKRVYWGAMACPPQYSFGTKIRIEGVGEFVCEDRGGKIKGNHFDMWFQTRTQALNWGKRTVLAEIEK